MTTLSKDSRDRLIEFDDTAADPISINLKWETFFSASAVVSKGFSLVPGLSVKVKTSFW